MKFNFNTQINHCSKRTYKEIFFHSVKDVKDFPIISYKKLFFVELYKKSFNIFNKRQKIEAKLLLYLTLKLIASLTLGDIKRMFNPMWRFSSYMDLNIISKT